MAKIRIYEWAKKVDKPSNVIISELKKAGHPVRNHTSTVEESVLSSLFSESKPKVEQVKEEKVKTEKEVEKPKAEKKSDVKLTKDGHLPPTTKKLSDFKKPASKSGYQHPKPAGSTPRNAERAAEYQKKHGSRPNNRGGYNNNNGNYNNNRTGGYNNNRPGGYNNNNNGGGYNNNRPGGYNNNRPGGYNNNNGGGYNNNRPGGFNAHKGGFKGNSAPKPEVEQTSKPTTKKTGYQNNKKRGTYNNQARRDQENDFRIDQKTKTQLKKEARRERELAQKNETTILKWTDDMTVASFASKIDIPAIDVISKLFELGIMATMNNQLDKESAEVLCTDYNVEIVEDDSNSEFEFDTLIPEYTSENARMKKRAPIVTIMGHVDHGKTTLLDTIRNANVANKESGGITQHIGAYQIPHGDGYITFLDTPGHAAFSAMRARGAHITDITVLVVAADDGVMPQTKEAISHAKEANTPLIVAVNKMDKEGANPERVMTELSALGVMSEEWGGDVPFIKISALKEEGIDELLSYIDVLAEMHDYQAPRDVDGFGTVIEAHLDKGRGPVATIIVEGGEVNVSDSIIIGHTWGNVRVMQDEYNKRHKTIYPSMPVEITGLKDVPEAGDRFLVMKDSKQAQSIGEKRSTLKNQKDRNSGNAMSLEDINSKFAEGEIKELPIVLKADVQGSVEALSAALEQIDVNGAKVRIVHKGVGAINESDAMLCQTGNAIMIGFNVRPDQVAKQLIEKENIDLLLSSIIYKIIEEIEDSMRGMRDKKYREEIIGYARVDEVFKISNVGKVAGCIVTEGKITRSSNVRLIRDDIVIYDGELGQLKRFKDDVSDVVEGMDCGMSFKDFNDIKKGDQFEAYLLEEVDLDIKEENTDFVPLVAAEKPVVKK